jgi:hypothetical protein
MLPPIIMMMEGKHGAQIEAEEKRARRREGTNRPLNGIASWKANHR